MSNFLPLILLSSSLFSTRLSSWAKNWIKRDNFLSFKATLNLLAFQPHEDFDLVKEEKTYKGEVKVFSLLRQRLQIFMSDENTFIQLDFLPLKQDNKRSIGIIC